MIPNKIYLNSIHPEPYWFKDKQVDSDIEYIRKDTLLEWLNRMLEISAQSFEFQRNYAYGKVIDKLNEM